MLLENRRITVKGVHKQNFIDKHSQISEKDKARLKLLYPGTRVTFGPQSNPKGKKGFKQILTDEEIKEFYELTNHKLNFYDNNDGYLTLEFGDMFSATITSSDLEGPNQGRVLDLNVLEDAIAYRVLKGSGLVADSLEQAESNERYQFYFSDGNEEKRALQERSELIRKASMKALEIENDRMAMEALLMLANVRFTDLDDIDTIRNLVWEFYLNSNINRKKEFLLRANDKDLSLKAKLIKAEELRIIYKDSSGIYYYDSEALGFTQQEVCNYLRNVKGKATLGKIELKLSGAVLANDNDEEIITKPKK